MDRNKFNTALLGSCLAVSMLSGCIGVPLIVHKMNYSHKVKNELEPKIANMLEQNDEDIAKEDTIIFNGYQYRIVTIDTLESHDGRTLLKEFPKEFVLIEDKGYRVEKLNVVTADITSFKYVETIANLDGTTYYCVPDGYVLVGNKAVRMEYIYTPVKGNEAKEIIENYLENNNSLKLTK